jgi:hypothetical protein
MAGPEYRYEYVSASVFMGPITSGTEWSLVITLANRGQTTEHFRVQFIRGPQPLHPFETFESGDYTVEPLRSGGYGLGNEADPGVVDWEQWWVRIFVTSRNLVPTMRFDVEEADPATPPAEPEFFFGPGDFAVFPLQVHVEPPTTVDPTNTLTEG